ncbi:hypothetical protein BDY17DRAFT_55974 [Neohortaea acidophila]|uniref:PUM-HD domain-containing protein n=1 Tax=Neohortaea acidophila TaxID=245834 RepID=A0A6A6PF87_9PEZI|nr:uncharacterized protein BDY17DRAFT_55974 [Neohortaea acidophila]KAF2478649.1 hypothetical protein BDY17DRAFT_55974 [Neohortaea acidophila]
MVVHGRGGMVGTANGGETLWPGCEVGLGGGVVVLRRFGLLLALPHCETSSCCCRWLSLSREKRKRRNPSSLHGGRSCSAIANLLSKSGLQSHVAPSERRIRHIERLLEQQRHINAELEKIDDETRREVEDGLRHERAVSDMIAQSEPTTPPEYHEPVRNVTTRTNRYSAASLTSPPGIPGRPNRSSTRLTSPAVLGARPYSSTNPSALPSQSVPGSRRHSDDEEEVDILYFDPGLHRSAANLNRNSMPAPSYDRQRNSNAADLRSSLGALDHSSFFTDEEEQPSALPTKLATNKPSPPDIKTYLQVQHTADGFPKLIRRSDDSELVSGPSAALDLALNHLSNVEQPGTDRLTASRHRISLPPSAVSSNGTIAPLNGILTNSNDFKSAAAASRRSLEVKFSTETKRPSLMATPPRSSMSNGMAKAASSYSTNDIPTLKSIESEHSGGVSLTSTQPQARNTADSATQDLNGAHRDRTASDATAHPTQRQSQDFVNILHHNPEIFATAQAALQGNGASFGGLHFSDTTNGMPPFQAPHMPYGQSPYYGGMQSLNNGFGNMNLTGGYAPQGQWGNQPSLYQPNGFSGMQQYPSNGQAIQGAGRYDANKPATHPRKAQTDELYANVSVPGVAGQIYGLCKDQHGCRFLQRKLEEKNEQDVQIIFDEVKDHFQELMVDPFGNYLCQRLLEHCNNEQRTVLVKNAAPAMTRIALNQHGTRALQRMIESIATPEQTNMLIDALRYDVVQLIQDLNGNHVIQKCLNHLSSRDAQFIFDAVSANCVVVGTHRHGCCVVQRCVDHATGPQKGAMVDAVIDNAFALVQDPFGNYVVQYVLDLNEPMFTEPLCRSFAGNIAFLSKQKFSSNVIEKCIRSAGPDTRRILIHEISSPQDMERLLRDSFANYVVQTAMDTADEELKAIIVESLRPMIPAIRNTPHGRRIQSKIQDYDNGNTGPLNNANINKSDSSSQAHSIASAVVPSVPPFAAPASGRSNRMGMVGAPPEWSVGHGFTGPAVNGFHGPAMNGFNAPNVNGFPGPAINGFSGQATNGYHGPAANGFNGPAANGGYSGGDTGSSGAPRSQAYNALNGSQNYPQQGMGGPGFPGFGRNPHYGQF